MSSIYPSKCIANINASVSNVTVSRHRVCQASYNQIYSAIIQDLHINNEILDSNFVIQYYF